MLYDLKTPKKLRRDNFDLDKYARRAAETDIRMGFYDRNDYLSFHPAYLKRREELLQALEKEKEDGQK